MAATNPTGRDATPPGTPGDPTRPRNRTLLCTMASLATREGRAATRKGLGGGADDDPLRALFLAIGRHRYSLRHVAAEAAIHARELEEWRAGRMPHDVMVLDRALEVVGLRLVAVPIVPDA